MPSNATSNGSCLYPDDNHQAITIRWAADRYPDDFNSITVTFERNQSRYYYQTLDLHSITSIVYMMLI
jgi:hypothetical protein